VNSLCRILSFWLLVFLPAARVKRTCLFGALRSGCRRQNAFCASSGADLFTGAIEPAFSSIQVFDATGKQVDKKDTHSDRSSCSLLQISLPRLGPGTYKVAWGVVSVDTHVTKGDFRFQIVR